jgi:UDP-N-acetylglucosamine:LPS N-acetylglucosamine transferase
MERKFSINVVTGQGGAGHYATYHAIRAIAEQQHLPWHFQVTDMDDIITALSQKNQLKNTYSAFGSSAHDLYNSIVKKGWTWLWPLLMRINKQLVKQNYPIGVSLFEQHWREQQPDLVVSVMPLFNQVIWESLQRANPNTPVVTLLTDFADCPPDFWFAPNTGNYFVCGTDKAVAQAQALGINATQIVQTSGLVIHPDFAPRAAGDRTPLDPDWRRVERQRLGLDPDCITALVTFGANGTQVMLDIVKRLEQFQENLQLILICGRNEALATQLLRRQGIQKRVVTTFTKEMPYYMQLADFFIGKPGNVSVSEAIAMQLPVITECNALTMMQERDCAEWIRDRQLGLVMPSFRSIDRAVATLIEPATYARYRANLSALHNQAGFEVIELLQRLLPQSRLEASLPIATEPVSSWA